MPICDYCGTLIKKRWRGFDKGEAALNLDGSLHSGSCAAGANYPRWMQEERKWAAVLGKDAEVLQLKANARPTCEELILRALENEGQPLKQLSAVTGRAPGTIHFRLEKMIKRGLIAHHETKMPVPKGAIIVTRSIIVYSLTALGRKRARDH